MMIIPVPSPCIDVCEMDSATGWCAGCLRTLDEIACWSVLDDVQKQGVWQCLDERRVLWTRQQQAAGRTQAAP